jgi:predicted DsbA family dithiol-disulfide isomerase
MATEIRAAVDIWSDYVCPFCYLEMPAIVRLQEEFGPRVEVAWHAFELRPEPAPTLDPKGAYLRDLWAASVYPMARQAGMKLVLPPVQPRSRKAFEAVEYARTVGRFDAMHLALFKAFFEEGRDIEDTETLLDIGASVGLDMNALKGALDAGRYTHRVLEAEQKAQRLGISGVPLSIVRGQDWPLSDGIVLRGAVPYDSLRAAIEQVLASPD